MSRRECRDCDWQTGYVDFADDDDNESWAPGNAVWKRILIKKARSDYSINVCGQNALLGTRSRRTMVLVSPLNVDLTPVTAPEHCEIMRFDFTMLLSRF